MSNQNPNSESDPLQPESPVRPSAPIPSGDVAPQAPGGWQEQAAQAGAAARASAPVHPHAAAAMAGAPSAAAVAAKPLSSKKGNAPLLVTVLLLVLLIVAGVGSCVSGSAANSSSISLGDRVAVITLDGTIQYDGSACSPEGFKMLLDEAANDPSIKAVVLRVNPAVEPQQPARR